MMTWLEMVAHYKGYQNLLQESAQFRLPPTVRKPRDPAYRRLLRGLGRRLVRWGQMLQERYPAPVSPPPWQVHRAG
ncbi:MAG: hypothetical protein H5T61_01380 [Thermoflexales bacterium]|nr:hypothetical protein [Thermoflexales bacterium]